MLGATAKSSGSMEGPAVKPLDVGPETMVHLVSSWHKAKDGMWRFCFLTHAPNMSVKKITPCGNCSYKIKPTMY